MGIPSLAVAAALVVASCGEGAVPDSDAGNASTTIEVTGMPPEVDMSTHSVPLDEIYFDTFDGGAVPLSESEPELRARLLDAIPPIDEPVYEDAGGGDWLNPDDPVLGYVAGEQAYAYPFKILNYHEIVNDTLDGVPVLISYCPLCRSAIVYDRRVDGEVLSFSNTSALYESDMVMVDRQTGSYWWQVAGSGIVGPLTGSELNPLPASVTTWDDWKDEHPDTLVLTRDTGHHRPYENDPFAGYPARIDSGQFPFPVSDTARDDRLPPSALVVGLSIGGEVRAYRVDELADPINDQVGGQAIVVLPTDGGARVFSADVDGKSLELESKDGAFMDTTTQSTWSATGTALSGPLRGETLEPLGGRTTYWFAFVAAFPDAELHRG